MSGFTSGQGIQVDMVITNAEVLAATQSDWSPNDDYVLMIGGNLEEPANLKPSTVVNGLINFWDFEMYYRYLVPVEETYVESNTFSYQPSYRFGFQGQERDDEIKGIGNSYTTLFRMYDPRLGRWFSVDPKADLMPWQSSYAGIDNNPVVKTDPKGDCSICAELEKAGYIYNRGALNDLLKTSDNVTHVSPSQVNSHGGPNLITELANASPPYQSISETQVTSSITFSQDKSKITITRITVATHVMMGDYGPLESTVTTMTQSLNLGITETGTGSFLIDYELPLVDRVNESGNITRSPRYNRSKHSSELNKMVEKASNYNRGSPSRIGKNIENVIQENSVKDNFEGYEHSEAPDPVKKRQ